MCSIVSADTSAHVHDVTGTWEFVTGVSAESVSAGVSSESSVSASTFAPTAADSDSRFEPSFFLPLSPWYLPTWFHHQSVL